MTDAPSPTPTPNPNPTPPPSRPDRAESRRGAGVWPIVLIALGALFLLNNLGALDLGAVFALLAYWPVALIAIGADLLTSGRYRVPIVIAAVAIALVLWSVDGGPRRLVGGATSTETVAVDYALGGAAAARVTLDLGVGRVRVDDAAAPGALATGSIRLGRGEALDAAEGRENGTALLELRTRAPSGTSFGIGDERNWTLSLTREVPLALRVTAGVGENRFDLRSAQLVDLSFRGGVGETILDLPGGSYAGSVDVGVGATTVRVPSTAAVRVTLTTGLGRADVSGTWNRVGDVYTTPGFDTASERIDLRVAGGVGSIRVERR